MLWYILMTSPIPVILITGFLGAGKTSFINQVLKDHPNKLISLILNEFGSVKLESQFIEVKGVGMISELSGGCLCCVANVDLPRVIRYTLEHAPQTQYLIVEASGLSDPDPVRSTMQSEELSGLVHLDTVVAIVDTDNFETTAATHPLVLSQIADADYAVISKAKSHSLVEIESLIKQVSSIGTGTRTFVWDDQFDTGIIFDPPLPNLNKREPIHEHVHSDYDEYWYQSSSFHSLELLSQILHSLPDNILRVKGYLDTQEGERILLQKVGHHVDLRSGNIEPTNDHCIILVLGQNLDHSFLNTQFSSCIIS